MATKTSQPEAESDAPPADNKDYPCRLCLRSFSTAKARTAHMADKHPEGYRG